jgi:ERF superfamily
MSENLGVYKAIVSVMSEIGITGISKNRNNAQQGYKFRGIDDVYNELNPLFSKHNLLLLPNVKDRVQIERLSAKGTPLFYTSVTVEFTLVCAIDGTSAIITTVGEAMDSADKSSNKALSAAYKYAAMMLFCIPTEADNDSDATTHDIAPQSQKLTPTYDRNPIVKAKFDELTKAIRERAQHGTIDDLAEYWADNKLSIAALPADWRDILSSEKEEAKTILQGRVDI